METIRKIRCAHHRDGKSIREIARDFHLSRNTVKKVLRSEATEFTYQRSVQPMPKLGPYEEMLLLRLTEDRTRPRKEQRTAMRLFEGLQQEGFDGGYDSVRRYVKKWRKAASAPVTSCYIPQSFDPGEAYQFDWSHELVELAGIPVKVKVAHFRLCHSREPFVVAYPRESLEMVLDAHVRAFAFFGGSPRRGIYDNLKTVVTKILLGKNRTFHRRFLQLCSHYLVDPVACTPAAGWEKGQVENQVGFIRERIFVPRLKCRDFEELNRELADRCRTLSAGHPHPEFKERTVAQVYAEERAYLLGVPAPFEAYKEAPARVTSTCLVSFDSNRYSVDASAVGRTVMLRAYADRVVCVDAGVVVGEHPRLFGKNQVRYDPWHYLSVLERKPGALRNGAPFKDWDLPDALSRMRTALGTHADGDRQFVGILSAIRIYGLEAVESACGEALAMRAASKDVVWNLLSRSHDHANSLPGEVDTGEPLERLPILSILPINDCGRYDALLTGLLSGGSYAAR